MICSRCSKKTYVTLLESSFNNDLICLTCLKEEQKHPKYKDAVQGFIEAEKRGDTTFEGIGLPPDLIIEIDKTSI